MENSLSRDSFFNEFESSFSKIKEDIIKAQQEVAKIKEILNSDDIMFVSKISEIAESNESDISCDGIVE